MAEIRDWDVVAANNNSAAPDGWPEGMNYSDVNNVGRENMAVMARYHKDTNGSLISGGAGNVYDLTPNRSFTSFVNGMLLKFRADKTNTGAVTVTIPVVGTADVKRQDGEALAANDIQAGGVYEIVYSTDRTAFILANADITATESRKGVVEIATEAEHLAGTSTTLATNPAGVAAQIEQETTNIFGGANQDLSSTGYQIFPSGLIMQWGNVTGRNVNVALPLTFPNGVLTASTGINSTSDASIEATIFIVDNSNIQVDCLGSHNTFWTVWGH